MRRDQQRESQEHVSGWQAYPLRPVADVTVQFHLLAFEGPDTYAQASSIAPRVTGLAHALAHAGFATHLWFVGDPTLPDHENQGQLRLHRWCQGLSRCYPRGVYDGAENKHASYTSSLPPFVLQEVLVPHLREGRRAVILAEGWHTVQTVLHLDWLLRRVQLRPQVTMLWNASTSCALAQIDWRQLAASATLTTVNRSLKHQMQGFGVHPFIIPHGLSADDLRVPEPEVMAAFGTRLRGRSVLSTVTRWDAKQRGWLALDITSAMKCLGWRPLLLVHGGTDIPGDDVAGRSMTAGLRVVERSVPPSGICGLLSALTGLEEADVVHVRSPLDPLSRRVLFRGADVVLATSAQEPCALAGLETMAVGGLACTGCAGEDYAIPSRNALVLETTDPWEFLGLFAALRARPAQERAIRRAARATARHYLWSQIVGRILWPRLDFLATRTSPDNGSTIEPLDPQASLMREAHDRRWMP